MLVVLSSRNIEEVAVDYNKASSSLEKYVPGWNVYYMHSAGVLDPDLSFQPMSESETDVVKIVRGSSYVCF